jgi:hypothetical protein
MPDFRDGEDFAHLFGVFFPSFTGKKKYSIFKNKFTHLKNKGVPKRRNSGIFFR